MGECPSVQHKYAEHDDMGEPSIERACVKYGISSAKLMASIRLDRLVRYFVYLTIFNLFAAVAFTTPVIIPQLAFPLKLTIWPGTWMFIAYFVFLIVGVLGTLGWAVLLDLIRRITGVESCDRFLAITSIVLIEVPVYTQTSLMFTAGYIGGTYAFATQVGSSLITYIIGPLVIPIGVSIFIYLIGTLLGLMNVVFILSERRSSAAPTTSLAAES
jgi:hypothetical protein